MEDCEVEDPADEDPADEDPVDDPADDACDSVELVGAGADAAGSDTGAGAAAELLPEAGVATPDAPPHAVTTSANGTRENSAAFRQDST